MTTKTQTGKKSVHENEPCKSPKLGATASAAAVLAENLHFQNTLQKTLDEGVADIVDQAQRYKNNPVASRVGFVAEADHCATYNARSALERSTKRAIREPNGTHGDYKIVNGQQVLIEGEMKYYSTAEQTETAMRGYGDRQLVGPADQIADVKKIAAKKAAKNNASDKPTRQQVGLEHESVTQNAGDCISDGKTKSSPRTRREARKIAGKAAQGKTDHATILPTLGEDLKIAAKSGAKSGAATSSVITGVISGFSHTKEWLDGEKDGGEALIDAAVDIGKSGADGAVKGMAGSVATTAATRVATQTSSKIFQTVLRSGGPAVIAIGTVEVVKHAFDLSRGEIDGEEFVEKSAQAAATGAGGWAGAEGGAALGLLVGGPVGSIVGGVLGGIGGALGIGCLFS